MSKTEEFRKYRQKLNERILRSNNTVIKRIYSVDTLAYEPGVLDAKTKEMLGLVSSLVLRCDDCVKYHIEQSFKAGLTEQEFFEVLSIACLVGGTIVIPHMRRAVEYWDELTVENI
jgi:AhpD family alkylhydroperoxidase